jgi:hypothetical protein
MQKRTFNKKITPEYFPIHELGSAGWRQLILIRLKAVLDVIE